MTAFFSLKIALINLKISIWGFWGRLLRIRPKNAKIQHIGTGGSTVFYFFFFSKRIDSKIRKKVLLFLH